MGESNELSNGLEAKAFQEVTAERDRLRAEVAELRRALDEARLELRDKAAITAERDQLLKSLYALWPKDDLITEEDIAEMDKNGVDFGDIIAEIETDLRARGLLHDN